MWAGSHKLQKQNWLLRRFRSRVVLHGAHGPVCECLSSSREGSCTYWFFKCRGDGLWIDSLVGAEHSLPHCTESAALTQRHTRALQQEAGCENITSVTLCEYVSAGLCVCVWAWIYYIAVNEWLRLFHSVWSECVRVCVRLNRGNEAAFSLCHVAQSLECANDTNSHTATLVRTFTDTRDGKANKFCIGQTTELQTELWVSLGEMTTLLTWFITSISTLVS